MKTTLILALALTCFAGTTGCTLTIGGPIAMEDEFAPRDEEGFFPRQEIRMEEPSPVPSEILLTVEFDKDESPVDREPKGDHNILISNRLHQHSYGK